MSGERERFLPEGRRGKEEEKEKGDAQTPIMPISVAKTAAAAAPVYGSCLNASTGSRTAMLTNSWSLNWSHWTGLDLMSGSTSPEMGGGTGLSASSRASSRGFLMRKDSVARAAASDSEDPM